MKLFPAILHQEKGHAVGLSFPDIPGCFAASDDMDGIVAAGAEALALWFEDQPDVEPSPVNALVSVDLDGGALIMIPYIKPTQDVVRANLSLPRGVLAAIDAGAKARNLTRSAFVAHAALAELEGRH